MAVLAKRLEQFISPYNATCDEILLSLLALLSRLDEFVKDMPSLVNNTNELMKKQEIRLCALKQSLLSNPQTTYKGISTNLHSTIVTVVELTHQTSMFNHHCQLNDLLTIL